jgi:hypothetical protein
MKSTDSAVNIITSKIEQLDNPLLNLSDWFLETESDLIGIFGSGREVIRFKKTFDVFLEDPENVDILRKLLISFRQNLASRKSEKTQNPYSFNPQDPMLTDSDTAANSKNNPNPKAVWWNPDLLKSIPFWSLIIVLVGGAFSFGKYFGENRFDKVKIDLEAGNTELKYRLDSVTDVNVNLIMILDSCNRINLMQVNEIKSLTPPSP